MPEFNQTNELVKTVYVSSAVNSTPHCLDWGSNGLVIYGSCNAIHLYDPQITNECDGRVISSFVAHTMRVNCVKWVQNINKSYQQQDFVSCSTDCTVVLWENVLPSGFFKNYEKLIGHSDVVTVIDALRLENLTLYIASASGDCSVKIWTKPKNQNKSKCFQTIDFDNILCLSLKITVLPQTNCLLLACGLSNSKIQLFINDFSSVDSVFVASYSLLGHEDWIRSLDFVTEDSLENLFLASGSQDSVIRLWKFTIESDSNACNSTEELGGALKLEHKKLSVVKNNGLISNCVIQLETVISGHDGWIYGVHWRPNFHKGKKLELLSVSMDKTLAVWTCDEDSGLWVDCLRLGEVGGNTLGFYGGKFSPDGGCILAQGHSGSFHLWKKNNDGNWIPEVTVGGHFGSVEDIAWDPAGKYIVSVSSDQTSRIHAQWLRSNKTSTNLTHYNWHEMARPQVHGYNMSSVAMLTSLSYVSSAEEKVIRVFQAPYNFIENMSQLAKIEFPSVDIMKCPLGASVPSLGLSNKAVSEDDCKNTNQHKKKDFPEHYFIPLNLKQPPTEEDLVQNTLWPEIQKLYGHVYEIYCLASSPNNKWLASAAKATSLELASIIIWDMNDFQQVQKLVSHNLTVTQLAFSPDNTKLLSVSRDRTWSLFEFDVSTNSFTLKSKSDKRTGIHARIIWCCAWTHDSIYFATGSRDGKLVIWGQNDQSHDNKMVYSAKTDHLFVSEKSFTAVAFAPTLINKNDSTYLLAIGADCGNISLYKWMCEDKICVIPWFKIADICNEFGHHLTVKKIQFQPLLCKTDIRYREGILQMASCGADTIIRVYDIFLKHFS